jgi:hypothetical protein
VEQRAELETLQRALVQAELSPDPQGEIRDPACVGGRVLVVRLESVGERLDRGDEGALEALVARGVGDGELRLLREAAEQCKLALAEVLALDKGNEATRPATSNGATA